MIVLGCDCGKKLKTGDDTAGRRVKCSACGRILQVPVAEPPSPAAGPTITCRGCGKSRPLTGLTCPHCGFNPQTSSYVGKRATAATADERGRAFHILGVAFTRKKLALVSALVLLVVAAGIWYISAPKSSARNVAVGPVKAKAPNRSKPQGYFQALARARQNGSDLGVAITMQQIGYAMTMYINDHDQLPDQLDRLAPSLGGYEQIFTDPQSGKMERFVYVRTEGPLSNLADRSKVPILYQAFNGQIDKGGAVLYADGHVRVP